MMNLRIKLFACSFLFASSLFARGWTVSKTDSSGANFTLLQKAIDSASAHDTLWLDHGDLGGGTLSKPLVFIGRQANATGSSSLGIAIEPTAAGSSFWGVTLTLSGTSCVGAIEVGYSVVNHDVCLEGAYIHHSRVTGLKFHGATRSSRFQNVFMDDGAYPRVSSQNIYDHVTVHFPGPNQSAGNMFGAAGGIGGLEHIVTNSVMSSTVPMNSYTPLGHSWARECHFRNSLLWTIDSVESDNSAIGSRFKDSSLTASGPFTHGFHVKPAYAQLSEDGTEPGIFGGKHPLRLVGNEDDLIPLMPLPWLRTVALERLRVASSDSVKVSIEAIRGK